MAPSAVGSPNKRRKIGRSPTKQLDSSAQPSLFTFFNNGQQAKTTRPDEEVPHRDVSSVCRPSGAVSSYESLPGDSRERIEIEASALASAKENTNPSEQDISSQSSCFKSEKTSECPICCKRVNFSTIQAHVNTCLDSIAIAPGQEEISRSEVLNNNVDSIEAANHGEDVVRSCSPASSRPQTPTETPLQAQDTNAKMTSISKLASSLDAAIAPTSTEGGNPSYDRKNRTASFLSSAKKATSSAFTVLMKSHSESKQWATADAVEAANYRGKARSRPEARTAPFYKALEGMPLTVDAFRFGKIEGCRGYFLTHFHSDHYGGMTANWNHGPIYCSVTTANLCRTHLGVDPQWLRPLPMEVVVPVPDSGGVTVTCIEANHCPGSCLFLFEGPQTCQLLSRNHASPYIGTGRIFRYLHCGDFRASPVHTNHPSILGKKLDIIYLDTTYCNPRYCFPAQDQVIEACAELVRRIMPEEQLESNTEAKRIEAEQEDWTKGPSRRARGSVDNDSSVATAFRDWFHTKREPEDESQVKVEDPSDESVESLKPEDLDLDNGEEGLFRGEDTEDAEVQESPGPRVKLEPSEDALLDFDANASTSAEPSDTVPSTHPLGQHHGLKGEEYSDGSVRAVKVEGRVDQQEDYEHEDKKPQSNWLTKHSENSRESVATGRRKGRLLVVIGTYTIGKERIVKAVARAMNSKIFCMDSRKYRVYQQLEDAELHSMLTRSPSASVHVTNLHAINGEGLRDVVAALRTRGHDFTHAVAFRPTGWTYKPPAGMDTVSPSLDRLIAWNQSRSFGPQNLYPTRDSTPDFMIYGVPYSEHSSFFELTAFALSTRYDRIIATVNVGNPNSRAKMAKWFEKWMMEKRRREKLGMGALDSRAVTYW